MAMRNRMEIALSIAIGSSTQIALFVAPLLVLLSLVMAQRSSLAFSGVEFSCFSSVPPPAEGRQLSRARLRRIARSGPTIASCKVANEKGDGLCDRPSPESSSQPG